MRFKLKRQELIPDERNTVTKFLLLPLCINGECRWLETATYSFDYHENWGGSSCEFYRWEDV